MPAARCRCGVALGVLASALALGACELLIGIDDVSQGSVDGAVPGDCLDIDLEPNDTPQTATNLDGSLSGHPQGVSMYGNQICTPDDLDYYSFTVTTAKHALVVVQYQRDQGELDAQLLDPSLATLATASAIGTGLQLEADCQPQSLPYYLVIKAGPGGTKNTYDFSVTFSSI